MYQTLDSLDSHGLAWKHCSSLKFLRLIEIRRVAPVCEDSCHQAPVASVSENPSCGLDQVIATLNLIIAWSL